MEPTYYQHLRPIPFRNESGETIPPFSVMRITGVDTANGSHVYTVAKPNATFHRFYLINNHLAVGDGKHGTGNDGRYSGAAVNWTAAGGYGASPGSWELEKDRPGFQLLESPLSAGVYKVNQQAPFVLMATVDSTIAASSSGNVTIRTSGGVDGPWGPVTALNNFVDSGSAVATGAKVFILWNQASLTWQIIKSGGGGGGDFCTDYTDYATGQSLDTTKEWVVKLKYISGSWTCVPVEVGPGCS